MPVVTVDACVGGINAFDSPENMAPTDAIALDNWVCRSGYLESRPYFTQFYGAGVDSGYELMDVFHGPAADIFLGFRSDAGVGKLYDLGDTVPATPISTAMTENIEDICRFHINDKMIILSGDVAELAFNGTTCTALDYTGSSPSIPTTGAFTFGCNFKGRAMYINEADCSFWYAEAGSYQGNITEFPLDLAAQYGGSPKHIAVWTMDTGTGPDDVFVIYLTSGEVLIYQGDDPGDIDNWEIAGSFLLAEPITKHASVKVGADLVLFSRNGYVNLADMLKSDQRSDYPAYSRRIWPMVAELIEVMQANGAYFTNYNRAVLWADGIVIFQFHMTDGDSLEKGYQFVLNISTGAWSRWTISTPYAATFAVFEDNLYYSDLSYFYRAMLPGESGYLQDSIRLSAIPAFSNLGITDKKKHITAVQFDTTFPDPSLIQAVGYSDFNIEGAPVAPTGPTSTAPASETGLGEFPYVRRAMLQTTRRGWQNINAYGFTVSMAIEMAMNDPRKIYWRQSTYRFRLGGAQ